MLLIVLLAVPLSSVATAQSGRVLLERWVEAATAHVPGVADEPALDVAGWSKSDLLALLRQTNDLSSDRALARGAVLHLDIALMVPARASGNLFQRYPRTGPARPGPAVLAVDGRSTGSGASSTHLEFARELLKRIEPDSPEHGIVRLWYVAAAAELARGRNFAELLVHLSHARDALPDDPEVLLASGHMHEWFAGPSAQAVARRQSTAVGGRNANLRQAERYYRDALSAAPDLTEARLRLGRVLGLQGKHADALVELRRALDSSDDRTQSYYVLMLLGRSEEALGQNEAARQYFERASELFPMAHSPWLALSRLAAEQGDEREAQRALGEALDMPSGPDGGQDPWWLYESGPGRYADRARAALHAALPEEGR